MSMHDHMNHSMGDMATMSTTMNHMQHMGNATTMNHMDMGGGGMDMGGADGGHNHLGMGPMNGTDDRSCSGMMMMFFHKGNCEYLLFEAIRTENSKGMIAACFAICALAILYEGLKVLREHLLQRSMIQNSKYAVTNGSASQEVVISNKSAGLESSQIKKPPETEIQFTKWIHMLSGSHFIQTLLHMLQVFISYCLMLVFMTYNVWLCLSVVLGAGLGYFLFGWRKAIVVDINEHCH